MNNFACLQCSISVNFFAVFLNSLVQYGEVDIEKDLKLARSLLKNGHMSPFEHAATPFTQDQRALVGFLQEQVEQRHGNSDEEERWYELLVDQLEFAGNFRGWTQFRAMLPNQRVYVPEVAG